jgi:cytochrome c556
MGFDINRAREVHFARMQKVLEEGLTNINMARTPAEADEARQRAQSRLEELNRMFEEAFPKEAQENTDAQTEEIAQPV